MAQPEIIKDIDARVKIAGDTMTGNLIGKYFQGTWLQTTSTADLGSSPSKIAVIRDDGWIYYRTPSELASDIGLTGNYVLKSGDTMTGNLTAPTFIGSLQGNASSSTYTCFQDTRNANEMPLDMLSGISLHLKSNSIDGLSDGLSHHLVLMLRDWHDLSGGSFAELTITGNQNLYFRSSTTNADNTWNPWRKVLTDYNYTSILNNTYLPLSGGTMSGPLNFANGIWNLVGDDCYYGDQNIAGSFCLKGNNGNTNLSFFQYGGSNIGKITWDGSTFIVSHTINGDISGSATRLAYQGDHTEVASNSDTSIWVNKNGMLYTSGLWISSTYNDSATPVSYGNIINIAGKGANQLLLQWATSNGTTTGHIYHRDQRDCAGSGDWHPWRMLWQEGDSITGAVWNDYAECREADTIEPGYVLVETGDDSLTKSTERLSPFAGVSSDTWGFSQGETDKAKTPIAVAGRVLVYPWQDRNNYKPGDCVCAAPEGKVDIMTREEIIQYPDRIVGTVSSVPTYDKWGGGENADREPVDVDGRIWIKVR